MKPYNRLRAYISLDAVEHNFEAMHKNISEGVQMIAVIKSDGYGHGAIPIAKLIEDYTYIWGFATATAEEALELRSHGIHKPILILGYVFEEYYEELVQKDIRPAVFTYETAKQLSTAAKRLKKSAHIHIALDTGMSRIGFTDQQESVAEIQKIQNLENLEIEGIFTHFARADEKEKAPAYTQFHRYQAFVAMLEEEGVSIPIHHCSNSAGLMRMKDANLDLVRAGISIYGIYPSEEVERDQVILEPVMELKSKITFVKTIPANTPVSYGGTFVSEKETIVATIPVGYADGYPRSLSNIGYVLIHGQKAPILGRVCMDQFMVDVTDIPNVKALDDVTLMGRDEEAFLSVDTLGALSHRFPYEFVCDIGKRVPRIYVKNGKEFGIEKYQ